MKRVNSPATRADVEEVVGRVVGEIVGDALNLIDKRFDNNEAEIREVKSAVKVIDAKVQEIDAKVNRIENKLNPTIDLVDKHSAQTKKLQTSPA